MPQLKVMTVVGTRPEIIRLSAVIKRLENSKAIKHILVHTGQNYDFELNKIFFDDLKLKAPDYYLDAAGNSPVETIGNILIKMDKVLTNEMPDAFLVLGDTNSCLAAIAAKKKRIPIFHMEAGNRCFDERVPEESNRKLVDHIADINLPYSDIAREYLIQEGYPIERIIKTGSPMYEVLTQNKEGILNSTVLDELKIEKDKYFLFSAHREENINEEQNFCDLIDSINGIASLYNYPVIISTHPRTEKKIKEMSISFHPLVRSMKPFGYFDYIKLQQNAKAVLSDSGTISEETSILGLKSLNIRQSHERPEAMEECSVIMTGLKKDRIIQGLKVLEENSNRTMQVKDYIVPNVSEKVLGIIISYRDYINRVLWNQ